jgi:acetyl esterase
MMPRSMKDIARRAQRSAERALGLSILGLPRPLLVRLVGGRRTQIDGAPLDEQAELLIALARIMGRRPAEEVGVARARRHLERDATTLTIDPIPMAEVRDRSIPGPLGPIPVRIYTPRVCAGRAGSPALVYYHGGGFALGSLDSHDTACRYFAERAACVVVSVDYRLAPEHKFPAAVVDAVAAYRWAREHALELGVLPEAIAVGGDSAGGNLSAVVCLEEAAAGRPLPAFQLLIYPATDMSRSMPSHKLFAKGFLLEGSTIQWFLDNYLRGPSDIDDVRASPIRAKDFRGQPPAMVITAGFDPLRDEGRAYAEKLREASVPTIVREDAGMFHGYFMTGAAVAVSREALAHAAVELRRALGKATASAGASRSG